MRAEPTRALAARLCATALALSVLAGCGGAAPVVREEAPITALDLYPLGPGQAWSYDVDTGEGDTVLAVTRVVGGEGKHFEVQSGGGEVLRYERRDDGWYRPARSHYQLRGPLAVGTAWPAGPGVTATIAAVHQTIQTPAGSFERCVLVEERGAASGQEVDTTYCPGVGPARVVSRIRIRGQAVAVTATLRGFTTLP